MRRHDKQHFAKTGELKISLQSTMRERSRKMATKGSSCNVKMIRRVGKEEGGGFRRTIAANVLCIALLFNLLFSLLLSKYFALTFLFLCLQLKICF
jgi:hypothetical protein